MLPPLLKIMINEPRLLTEHLEAYSQLLAKDVELWQSAVKRQLKWKVIMGGNLFLLVLFAGIALMLWGTLRIQHWSLIVVPLVPLILIAVGALMIPKNNVIHHPFAAFKKQVCNDIDMLRGSHNG